MVSRTSLVAFLFTLITLAIAQDSAPDSETAPTNVTLAQAMQSLAASDPQPQISELASLAAATPTATGSANSASSCQCLMPGLWCGTRSGNATLNAIVNGDFNGTHHDHHDGAWNGTRPEDGHSHNGTHHDGAWNGTRPDDYPHGLNGTHHDGEWNGTQPEGHHHHNGTRPEHRPQTLSGTCDWSTIYYCPEGSAPATNSLPCSQSQGKTKHCRELPMSFFDWCD
ncbi:hypothetical protein L207DRAFT_536190 [Hyaloscypha variabilis F]|uniref:Uncharacterized protein n=1 Tax=Hyaloscypha variabilis (strain UAMH 11265 / GT02V1 / F) TaxID=1149755 RepID=A0A2J6R1D7_HYAVF|nr:hypothetical protein L207DRAFT_536190 [Hyaloscypha variabilis F]